MTEEFYKNVYQKTYLPNDFRFRILGNMKLLEKSQIGWRQMLVPNLRNKYLIKVLKNYTESDFKVSWSCPILLDNLVQNLFPGLQMFITPGKNL